MLRGYMQCHHILQSNKRNSVECSRQRLPSMKKLNSKNISIFSLSKNLYVVKYLLKAFKVVTVRTVEKKIFVFGALQSFMTISIQ